MCGPLGYVSHSIVLSTIWDSVEVYLLAYIMSVCLSVRVYAINIIYVCFGLHIRISLSAIRLAFDFYGCSSCQTTSWFGLNRWNSWLQLATWHWQLDLTRQESHSQDSSPLSLSIFLPISQLAMHCHHSSSWDRPKPEKLLTFKCETRQK